MPYLFEFIRHKFVRNVATLQAGSFVGNIIQGGAGILIARLLQPELFGEYALAFGMAGVATLLVGAGIQEAVASVLGAAHARRDREMVLNISAFMLKLTLAVSLITLLILPWLPRIAGHFYADAAIGSYAALIILGVMLSSLFFAFVSVSLQASGNIRSLTGLLVFDQLIRYGLSLALVWQGFGVWGAVTGHLVGAGVVAIAAVSFFHRIATKDTIIPNFSAIIRRVPSVPLRPYLGFTATVAIDRNIGNLYLMLPVAMTGIFITKSETAFFKLAFGYVNLALSLLGPISILLNMEFPRIQAVSRERLIEQFKRVSLYALGISCVLTIGALAVASWAFRILYGESFMPSVSYVYGLIVYGALFGIGVGLGPMWRAINKVNISIMINVVTLTIGIPLGIVLIQKFDIWGAVAMVTIWYTVSHLISFIYLLKVLKSPKLSMTNDEGNKKI